MGYLRSCTLIWLELAVHEVANRRQDESNLGCE